MDNTRWGADGLFALGLCKVSAIANIVINLATNIEHNRMQNSLIIQVIHK